MTGPPATRPVSTTAPPVKRANPSGIPVRRKSAPPSHFGADPGRTYACGAELLFLARTMGGTLSNFSVSGTATNEQRSTLRTKTASRKG
jgi:hypothetical protein